MKALEAIPIFKQHLRFRYKTRRVLGRVLKLLIGYQKCSFLRAILARFNKFRTRPEIQTWAVTLALKP